jgi:hypothetical protein
MQPSQLGRIILGNASSSSDEMRVNPGDADQLDGLLAEVSAAALSRGPDSGLSVVDE